MSSEYPYQVTDQRGTTVLQSKIAYSPETELLLLLSGHNITDGSKKLTIKDVESRIGDSAKIREIREYHKSLY